MPSEWNTVPLADLIEADRGISYGIVQPGPDDERGVPVVRVSDIRNGRIETANPLKVSRDIEARYARTRLKGGELLLTLVGTVGEAAVVPEDLAGWNTARAVAVVPVRKEIGAYWVKLALDAPTVRHRISSRLNTTVQATLNLRDVAELPIVVPPLGDRRAIVGILGTLDDKIELNRQMNATLEAIARALFKDWFVDFGPARARMEESSSYLPFELWSLFPNELDDDGKPQGWCAGTIADFANLNPESWSRSSYPKKIDYVDLSNTKWGRVERVETLERATAPSRAQRVLRKGDTIVGMVRPGNGSFALVDRDGLTGSTGFAVFRPKRPQHREFIYLAATAKENIDRLSHIADGAAYPAVRPEAVLATEVAGYSDAAVTAFSRIAAPLLDRVSASRNESASLAALRDTLLPKLLSGELRILTQEHSSEESA